MLSAVASALGMPQAQVTAVGGETALRPPGAEGGEEGPGLSLSSLQTHRTPYRILLVDDDPATLMAMKHHLVRMRGPVAYQGARWPVSWL
jgi:hypothetical protein